MDYASDNSSLLKSLQMVRVPDTELPLAQIPWPPLGHKPLKERFNVLQPIASYPVHKHKHEHDHHH